MQNKSGRKRLDPPRPMELSSVLLPIGFIGPREFPESPLGETHRRFEGTDAKHPTEPVRFIPFTPDVLSDFLEDFPTCPALQPVLGAARVND